MKKRAAISANYEASLSKGGERQLFPFKPPTERKTSVTLQSFNNVSLHLHVRDERPQMSFE